MSNKPPLPRPPRPPRPGAPAVPAGPTVPPPNRVSGVTPKAPTGKAPAPPLPAPKVGGGKPDKASAPTVAPPVSPAAREAEPQPAPGSDPAPKAPGAGSEPPPTTVPHRQEVDGGSDAPPPTVARPDVAARAARASQEMGPGSAAAPFAPTPATASARPPITEPPPSSNPRSDRPTMDVKDVLNYGRLTGKRIGRYRLGVKLGVGGAATVYMGRLEGPHSFERLVAIKIIHEHLTEEQEFVTMFLDEARLAVRLAHPNVVTVFELGRDDGDRLFMVMEYLDGQPLSRLTDKLKERGETLDHDVLAWIGQQVAEGLGYAHDFADEDGQPMGLVHRDVSPDNIFLTYSGQVKLIDFGIAKAHGRETTTELGLTKGKIRFMAPEQALGASVDGRADVFSLAATLYGVALGKPLFGGKLQADALSQLLLEPVPSPRDRIPGFPLDFAAALEEALENDVKNRTESARAFSLSLSSYLRRVGSDDQKARIIHVLSRVFEEEKRHARRAIEELRAIPDTRPPPPGMAAEFEVAVPRHDRLPSVDFDAMAFPPERPTRPGDSPLSTGGSAGAGGAFGAEGPTLPGPTAPPPTTRGDDASASALDPAVRASRPDGGMRSSSSSLLPPRAGLGVGVIIAAGVAAAVIGGGLVVALVSGAGPAPSAAAAPPPVASTVTVSIEVRPADAEATVTVGDAVATGTPPSVVLPRGKAAVAVDVSASGYLPERLEAVPDRDRALVVSLSRPAPEASVIVVGGGAPSAPATAPEDDAPKPAAAPRQRPRRKADLPKSPIVTEYPY